MSVQRDAEAAVREEDAERAVRQEDAESFASRVASRLRRADMTRTEVANRPKREREMRERRRKEDAATRRELVDAFGSELAARIDPNGIYDIFHVGAGPVVFRDDPSNPEAFFQRSQTLNESGLPFGAVRRGLHGWALPKALKGLLSVDPDEAAIRKLASGATPPGRRVRLIG